MFSTRSHTCEKEELAEQLDWDVPDLIFYPTGGGTGLIGMWKAFQELEELGWISKKKPRMIAVQSTGCAPLVKAYDEGKAFVDEPWEPVTTKLHGVRVPKPLGDFLCLQVMRDSDGFGVMVSDDDVSDTRAMVAREEGFHRRSHRAVSTSALGRGLCGTAAEGLRD